MRKVRGGSRRREERNINNESFPFPHCVHVRVSFLYVGIFSSSLAEYVMGAIAYFAKDFPRLMVTLILPLLAALSSWPKIPYLHILFLFTHHISQKQRQERQWSQYCVTELRGKTMGTLYLFCLFPPYHIYKPRSY